MNVMTSAARGGRTRILLERELWEHKGGFVWAPAIAGAVALLAAVATAIGASLHGQGSLNEIRMSDPAKVRDALGAVGDMAMLGGIGITSVVLGFVLFFYALGSLHDDRKDRSVLFWKSMPVSDTATVMSKVAWAVLLAPLAAVLIGLAIGFGMWALGLVTTTVNGVSGASGILTHSHPFRVVAMVLALLPVYALWALPTVGWLMLCSAAAPSKPFLWALLIPVVACTLLSMLGATTGVGIDLHTVWYAAALRPLLSVFPMTFAGSLGDRLETVRIDGPEDFHRIFEAVLSPELLASSDLWLGALAGAVMIGAAIRLRRWRDEG